ncbi:P-loop containing nucleoside triphosphate hydrolase [Pseudocohnilembus persalinus]|uniref:p-loop containing nucleoside triphosphate hydrolase n=1 Tax=Pseudocohnilembus persalinus TaxID=266149 RepID=A0A0V0R8K3_PSEPJ|nr:P-loop containing nucleoside triphosphate hydrolase [Pseudocohnilembus persalinus]|eukprot:KRX10829.1 P-loop containing nucleoside triphosphate hydrolase [Pseudocohnilembus persalinus]
MEPQSEKTSFLGFVPAMVIQHLQDTIGKGKQFPLPQKQSVNSVVMFADISGFTNLTEKLSSQGTEGCEKIAFAINRYMELMVKEIGKSGGDIFKFAGDAMIIVWPPPEKTENAEVWLRDSTRKALQAALAIQQRLDATKIMDDIRLSVKIGFGVGKFSIVYVGGVFGRAEYLPAGDPLNQAFEAESYAPHGGVVIVSPQVYQIVSEFFEFTMCEKKKDDPNPKNFPFYRVQSVKQKIRSVADAVLINDRITAKDIEKIKSNVLSYVPKALQQYIQYEQERWSSELRKLSIMFMNIGIDLAHADSEEGLKKLQKVIQTVQKCVYIHEGSLNKFLMDDKGSTLIVVFGLPPMTHQDDAQRACLCGFLLQQELQKLDTKCSIGVATGLVFAGVVGTSGNRREYSVIGDSVNLAARIMGDAKGQKDIQKKFLCCETTYLKCQNQISFQFFAKRQFKGKSIKLNIYQPLNLTNEQFREINKMNLFPNLRTHKFSFPIKDAEDIKKQDLKDFQFMHGRQEIFRDACQHLDTFIKSKFKSSFTLIRGTFGIGKSLFLRKILINCYEKKEHYRPADESLLKFMIPLYEINQNSFDPKIKEIQQLMRHIFGIEFYDYVQNFPAPQKPYNEDAVKAEKKMIAKYIKQFFATYLQMQPKKKDNNNESATMSDNSSQYEAQINQKQLLDTPPLILVLDDLQQNDIYSFKIIRMLLKNFYRIYIFGAMRDEFIEKPVLQQPDYPNQEQICIDEVQKTGEILKEHGQEGRIEQKRINSVMYITNYLKKIIELEDLLTSDVPFMCYQINGPIIDKQNILDILVLKVASLIGDVFDLQMLYKVYPFKDIIKAEQLKQILFNLERIHFLEILDQNEYNIYFRFQDSFIRECIYQRLTYQQRRQLHLQVAEAIQTLPQYDDDENAEGDRLVYHWCLGENKKDITNQDQFSHKAKRSIIVKKITTILGKHDKTDKDFLLKSEVLQKKSDSNVTWADRFTVLSSKDLKYYRDETYYRAKPQEPLGYIPLRNIFQINALNENAIGGKQFAFKISTSGWIKKDKLMESRTFYFAAISDMQLEEWSIYLEFARAKAIYDDFVGKFGKISFPIGTQFNIDPIFRQILQANKKQNYEKEQVQTKIQPQGLSRRTSRAFNSKSFLQSLKVKQITNDQQLDKEEDLQTLKNQLQEFMQKGMLMFFAHVFEMSLQKEDEYKKFGEMTKFQKKYPDFFRQKSNVSTLQSPYKKGQVEIKSPNFQDQIAQFRQTLMAKNNKQSYDESEGQQNIDMENFLLNQGIGNNIQKNKIQKPVNRRSLEPTSLNIPKFDELKRKQTNLTQQSHQSDTQSSMLHIKQNEQIIETNRENKHNDFQSVSEESLNQGEEVKKNKNIENLQEEQNKQKEENEQNYDQDNQKFQNQIQIQNNDQKSYIGLRENIDVNENNLIFQNNSIINQPKQRKSSSFIQKEILEDAMTFSQFNNKLPQKKKSLNLENFPQIPNQNKTNTDSNELSQFQIQAQNKSSNMNQSGQNNNCSNNNNNNQNQDFQNSSIDMQTKLQSSQFQNQQIKEQQQQTSDNFECNQQKSYFSSMQIQEEQQYFLGEYDENNNENQQQVTKQPLAEIMEESDYTNTNTVTNSNSVYFQNQNPDQNNYRKSAILQSQIQIQNNNNNNIIGTNNNNIYEIANQQTQFNKNQNNFDIVSGQNNNSNLNFQNKEVNNKLTSNQNQEFQLVQNNNLSGSQIQRHEFIQQIKQTQPFSNTQVRKNSQIQQQQYQQQKQQVENQQFQFANNINNQSESRSSLTSSPIKIEKNINQNKRHSYEMSEKEKFSSHKSSISYIQKTQKKSLKLSEVDKNDYFDNFIGSQNLGIERQDSHLFKGRTSVDRQIAEQLIQQEEEKLEDLLQDYKFQPEKGKIQSELFKSVVFKSRPSLIFETEAQIYHKLKPPKNNSQHQQQQFNIKSKQIFQPYEGSLFTSSLSNLQTSQLTKTQMQKVQQIQQQQLQRLLMSTQIQSQISSTQQQQDRNQGQIMVPPQNFPFLPPGQQLPPQMQQQIPQQPQQGQYPPQQHKFPSQQTFNMQAQIQQVQMKIQMEEQKEKMKQQLLEQQEQQQMLENQKDSQTKKEEKNQKKKEEKAKNKQNNDKNKQKKCDLHPTTFSKNCRTCKKIKEESSTGESKSDDDYRLIENINAVIGKDDNIFKVQGNNPTGNMNNRLSNAILSNEYFKSLYSLKTFHEVIDEMQKSATHAQPWTLGGVGVPSSFFCCLYKFMTQKLTIKQVKALIDYKLNSMVRLAGFLYIRYCSDSELLWAWLKKYLLDDDIARPEYNQSVEYNMGEYVERLLMDYDYYGTRLPRIPVKIENKIKAKLIMWKEKRQRKSENLMMFTQFVPGAKVRAISRIDSEWHLGVIENLSGKSIIVRFFDEKQLGISNFQASEEVVNLGEAELLTEHAYEKLIKKLKEGKKASGSRSKSRSSSNDSKDNKKRKHKKKKDKRHRSYSKSYSRSRSRSHSIKRYILEETNKEKEQRIARELKKTQAERSVAYSRSDVARIPQSYKTSLSATTKRDRFSPSPYKESNFVELQGPSKVEKKKEETFKSTGPSKQFLEQQKQLMQKYTAGGQGNTGNRDYK